jgi:hypothetical protein
VPTPAGLEAWTPVDNDIDNTGQITLGVRFTVSEEKEPGGVAFRAPATIGGNYTWSLWETDTDDDPNGEGTGTLIDSDTATSAILVPDDWNYLDLPGITLSPGTVYTASVHTSTGHFVREANAFGSAGYSGQGVTLLQAGTDPNPPGLGSMTNGVFLDGASGYPDTSFNFTNYGITIWFADELEPVTGALSASTLYPTSALTGVQAMSGPLSGVTPVPTGAFAGTVVTPVSGALSAVTIAPSAALIGTVSNPAPPTFTADGLLDLYRENNAYAVAERAARPVACPNCGWPLQERGGVLNCPAGDYRSG